MMAILQPIDWTTVKDALYDWFAAYSELSVDWADQDAPQITYPYGVIDILSGPTRVGGQDEQRWKTNLTDVGNEVDIRVSGLRTIVVSCQARVGPPDTHNFTADATAIMSAVQASLGLPSVRETLRNAGVAIWNEGDIVQADVVIDDAWISICNLDVTCCLASNVIGVEKIGYIKTAKMSSPDLGIDEFEVGDLS